MWLVGRSGEIAWEDSSAASTRTHLDPRLAQSGSASQLLAGADAGIVGLLELLLQLVQLLGAEGGPVPPELWLVTVLRLAVLSLDVCNGRVLLLFILQPFFTVSPIILLASPSGDRLSLLPESGERAGKENRPLPALLSPQALPLLVLLLPLLLGFELAFPSLP